MARERHTFRVAVTARDGNRTATEWTGRCSCGRTWTGATYDDVEQSWCQHTGAPARTLWEATR